MPPRAKEDKWVIEAGVDQGAKFRQKRQLILPILDAVLGRGLRQVVQDGHSSYVAAQDMLFQSRSPWHSGRCWPIDTT